MTTEQTPRLSFDARLLSAVAHFRAKNDIRYYLNGVYWMPHPKGGAMLAATNGHQLGIAYDPEGHCDRAQINRLSDRLLVVAKQKKTKRVILVGERLVCIDEECAELHIEPGSREIEGKFPDLGKVLPDPEKLERRMGSMFNSRYIGDLGVVAGMLGLPRFGIGVDFWQECADGVPIDSRPMVARFEGASNFIVLTMSMRSDAPSRAFLSPFANLRLEPAPTKASDLLEAATA